MNTKTQHLRPDFANSPKIWPFPFIVLPNGWEVCLATVTPALARKMLDCNSSRQRRPKTGVIEKYRRDMVAGRWVTTHQGVAFDALGDLFDGQNRATAVELSGVAVEMIVWFGVGGEEEMKVTDNGAVRTAGDAAAVAGIDYHPRDISMVRQMALTSTSTLPLTNSELLALMDLHADAVRWVSSVLCDRGKYSIAPIRSAVGRAYYHCDLDRLERFVKIYLNETGWTDEPGEQMAVALHKYVDLHAGKHSVSNYHETRGKALRAIEAYMNRENIKTLVHTPANMALFPLPTTEG